MGGWGSGGGGRVKGGVGDGRVEQEGEEEEVEGV